MDTTLLTSKMPAPLAAIPIDIQARLVSTTTAMMMMTQLNHRQNEKCGERQNDEFKNQKCELFDPINFKFKLVVRDTGVHTVYATYALRSFTEEKPTALVRTGPPSLSQLYYP
jgi:hypothetical protein